MFKKTFSALVAASSVALVSPLAFPNAIEGCSNSRYLFQTTNDTEHQRAAAKQAKTAFCKSAKAALQNAGERVTF